MIRRAILVLLTVALLVRAAGAQPADRDAQAREHFEQGRAHYDQGRYVEALAAFSAGFEMSGRPLFLFNMAECARLAGDAPQARGLYRRYLALDAEGPLATVARQRLDGLGPEPPPAPAPPPITLDPRVVLREDPSPAPVQARADRGVPQRKPLLRRWGFWAAVGGVLVVGSLAAVLASRSGDGGCPSCPVADLR